MRGFTPSGPGSAHSGDEVAIPLVQSTAPPGNKLERLRVLQRMYAHAQYCWSGDHTVEAMRHATAAVAAEEGSDYFARAAPSPSSTKVRHGMRWPRGGDPGVLSTERLRTFR